MDIDIYFANFTNGYISVIKKGHNQLHQNNASITENQLKLYFYLP